MKRDRPSSKDVAGEGFDRYASGYEQLVDKSIAFTGRDASFFAKRKVDLLRQLQQARGLDLSDATLLDVGCGTGTTDQHFAGQVRTLYGVDISEEMLVMARQNVPGHTFSRTMGLRFLLTGEHSMSSWRSAPCTTFPRLCSGTSLLSSAASPDPAASSLSSNTIRPIL